MFRSECDQVSKCYKRRGAYNVAYKCKNLQVEPSHHIKVDPNPWIIEDTFMCIDDIKVDSNPSTMENLSKLQIQVRKNNYLLSSNKYEPDLKRRKTCNE